MHSSVMTRKAESFFLTDYESQQFISFNNKLKELSHNMNEYLMFYLFYVAQTWAKWVTAYL